jgi:AraC-like DNA-binding protein
MDALSHLLEDIHLHGAEYLYVSGRGAWRAGLKGCTAFHVVLAGPVHLTVGGNPDRTLQTGDIVFIPSGREHVLCHPDQPGKDTVWLMEEFNGHRNEPLAIGEGHAGTMVLSVRCLLDAEMARPLLSSLPTSMLISQGLDGAGPEWLRLGLSFLALESEIARPGRDTLINRLISMFLIECVRDYVEQLPPEANHWLTAVRDPYLSPALAAIHSEPEKAWTVADLASKACLSRSAFHDRFSEVLGMPPLTYLTEHRLRLAAHHLAQQDLGISRISERVGYSSEAAFSQAFRRQYGVSPSQYRKQLMLREA